MDFEFGDIVVKPDARDHTYTYIGYDVSTDEAIIRSSKGVDERIDRHLLLKVTAQDLALVVEMIEKRKASEEVELASEKFISAESFTNEQKQIGLRRAELIRDFEAGKITSIAALMEKMGVKHTAFDEIMKRWREDPRWQSLVPRLPGRAKGQSDQDPDVIDLYMTTFQKFLAEGVTQKALYIEFDRQCKEKGLIPFSKSTAGRIYRSIDPKKRDQKTEGSDFASKKYGAYPSSFELDRPLRRIQIDSSPADIEVVDSITGEPLGRPYLTVVWEDFSGGIMAANITFVPPCQATIAAALYQAFQPKKKLLTDHGLGSHRLAMYGAPAGVLVDKGSEHDNDGFKETCRKFDIIYDYRERPQQGGAVENAIKLINVFFIHRLAGSTGSSPKKSKDFQPKKKARYDLKTLQRLVLLEAIRLNDEVREGDRQSPNQRWDSYFADPNTPLNMPPLMRDAFGFMINMLRGGRVYVKREGIKFGGYVYDHGDLQHLVERKVKVSVRRSPLDFHVLYVLNDGVWKAHRVLKPNKVPRTLIEAQVWKRNRPKAGEMTQVGHDALTEIQDIIAATMVGRNRQARARESVALAETMGTLPFHEAITPLEEAKVESNRFANVKPFMGEDEL